MKLKQIAGLFALGGGGYAALEVLWRGYTHWTMALTGGTVLIGLSGLRTRLADEPPLRRCAAGAACITTAELIVGLTVNRWLRLDVWDYSREPVNLGGQICLKYALLWYLLSAPAMEIGKICADRLAKPSMSRYNTERSNKK